MVHLERDLAADQFVRVHRSTIVNRTYIKERQPGDTLLLASGRIVKTGRAYRTRARTYDAT